MSRRIQCSILTPEKTIFEGEVDFAVVQAHDGEMGFLADHAPLISELGVGECRLRDVDGAEFLVIDGGVVEVRENRMIILAEGAIKKEELRKADIENRLKEVQAILPEPFTDQQEKKQKEMKKLKAQLKVAQR